MYKIGEGNEYEKAINNSLRDVFELFFENKAPKPTQVIFRNPRTIVNWDDGTKTITKCMEGDRFSKELGFLSCLAKKVYGGHNQYKKFIDNAVVQEEKEECLDEMPF